MDDSSGWDAILTEGWGPLVLEAVVVEVERSTIGDRALLVRTVTSPDDAPAAWVERMHELVLAAIHVETGADLEALGSQAAWACYEEVWDHLASRWSDGGRLIALGDDVGDLARDLVAALPVRLAVVAGADTSRIPATPLTVDGRVLLDVEGLFAWIATEPEQAAGPRAIVDELLDLARHSRT